MQTVGELLLAHVTLGLAALFFLVAPWIQRQIVEGEKDAPAPVEH